MIALDNPLRFKKNLLDRIQKLIMTNDEKIRDKKLQYDINREAAKVSALTSGKIDKNEVVRGEKYYLLIKKEWKNKLSFLILI